MPLTPGGAIGGAVGGGVIGGAVVELILNQAGFVTGLAQAEGTLKSSTAAMAGTTRTAATGIGGAFSRMGTVTQIAVVAAAAALVKFGIDSVRAFTEAQQVTAQTEAVLKSTGSTAGVTADQVIALSNTVRDYSGASNTAVQSSENLLLTFTQVRNEAGAGNDIFTQSTQAIVDMATAVNHGAVPSMEQLNTATKAVGKALNDPVAGMTSLRRVTGAFTSSQVDMIKQLASTGHLLESQKLILAGLERAYGGAARAAGQTLGGQLGILASKFKDLEAAVGQGITPILALFAKGLGAIIPLLIPVARNLYLVVGAFAGLLGMSVLPEILIGIAGGLEAIGAVGAAGGLATAAAGLAAITGPEILAGLATLYIGFKAFQRVTGQGPPIVPIPQDFVSRIEAAGVAAGILPTRLEAIKQAMNDMGPALQKAGPLLAQMGTNTRDFADAAQIAAQKGQAAFQTFAGNTLAKAADAIQKWRQTTAASLNFVDDALASFAGKSHVAASQIVKSFQVAANEQKQFGRDIQTIMKRGGQDANGLAQQLVSMGKDGVAAAHAIANAHQKAFNSIVQGYAKGASAANRLAGTISGRLIGTLKDIETVLQAIAKKWGIDINVNDHASGPIASIQSHLNALHDRTVTVTVVTNTQSYKTFPGGGHAAGGVITRGAAYDVIGEGSYSTAFGRGAEAVLPLNDSTLARLSKQINKVGGSRVGPNINVTINTQGAMDPNQLAASVSRHLARTIREEALV